MAFDPAAALEPRAEGDPGLWHGAENPLDFQVDDDALFGPSWDLSLIASRTEAMQQKPQTAVVGRCCYGHGVDATCTAQYRQYPLDMRRIFHYLRNMYGTVTRPMLLDLIFHVVVSCPARPARFRRRGIRSGRRAASSRGSTTTKSSLSRT
jgi:hypothetical protein